MHDIRIHRYEIFVRRKALLLFGHDIYQNINACVFRLGSVFTQGQLYKLLFVYESKEQMRSFALAAFLNIETRNRHLSYTTKSKLSNQQT